MSSRKDKFVFTWRIERFHMLPHKTDEYFESPTFLVEQFRSTKWFLTLYPRGEDVSSDNFVSLFLERKTDDGPENITIEFDVSMNSVSNSVAAYSFKKGDYCEFPCAFNRLEIKFPGNICVVTCHMRMCMGVDSKTKFGIPDLINLPFKEKTSLPPEIRKELILSTEKEFQRLRRNLWHCPNQCFARTLISVEKRSIACRIKDIVNLDRIKLHLPVLSCSGNPALLIVLHKTMNGEVEDLEVKICFIDELLKNVLLVCKMRILGNKGEVFTTESSHLYENSKVYEIWNVESRFNWCEIKKYENAHLNFDFSFSDGSLTSNIEYSISEDYESDVSTKNFFPSDLFRLYTEKKFFDVTLQTNGKTFEAHKTVLCAMSPVFAAMFASDMKESVTNNIIIDDLNSDTINQMLTFLYSGNIVELEFAKAIQLFSAADKYQIVLLKNTCRKFLQENFSVENVISILSLADTHQDRDLKESAADFIYKNAVFLSPEWKILSDTNPQLALEIYRDTYSKFF